MRNETRFLARPEDEGIEVAGMEGPFLYDTRNRRYIDFLSGWCVGNFGWRNPRLRNRVARSKAPDYVYANYHYAPWVELARLLAEITPGKLQTCFRATGGTEAVDIALQIAMACTGRRRFVSIEGSYHGNSIGTVSVGASNEREPFPNRLQGCPTLAPPLDDRAADRLETILRKRDVAAVILEPIVLNAGVLIPEDGFMRRMARLCRRYGTLVIADEVATGFGRTGRLFACEHFDLEPDILCMAKAITGGVMPLGATITTERVARAVSADVGFYSTYGWHPLATDVAIENVRWIARHRRRLMTQVARTSDHIAARLSQMKFRSTVKLRVRGLAIGVETGDEGYAGTIVERSRKKGLLLSSSSDVVTMFPPLNIDRATTDAALDIMETALR